MLKALILFVVCNQFQVLYQIEYSLFICLLSQARISTQLERDGREREHDIFKKGLFSPIRAIAENISSYFATSSVCHQSASTHQLYL